MGEDLFIEQLPPKLEKQEQLNLLQRVANGDAEAKEKVILHNLRLVSSEVLHRFYTVDYDRKDLVSIGTIGLIKAVTTFRLDKGAEFSTYAIGCIDNEILMFLRKQKKTLVCTSLEQAIQGKDGADYKLEEKDDFNLEEEYEAKEAKEKVRELIQGLSKQEREIIFLYFGFYDRKYTQEEIAKRCHYSRSYISKLLVKILKKLNCQFQEPYHEKEETTLPKKLPKTIYEYFEGYTKEQIDAMLEKLTENDHRLIRLRFGDDLTKPFVFNMTKKDKDTFYQRLQRMRYLLEHPEPRVRKRTQKRSQRTIYQYFKEYTKDQVDEMIARLSESDRRIITLCYGEDLTKPVESPVPKKDKVAFYNRVSRMKKLLEHQNLAVSKYYKKTIYEYFEGYTKEQIDALLETLTEKERDLITLRFRGDLEKPLLPRDRTAFYRLIRKMKQVLEPECKPKKEVSHSKRTSKTIYEYFEGYTKEQIDALLETLTEKERDLIALRFREDLAKPLLPKDRTAFHRLIQKMKNILEPECKPKKEVSHSKIPQKTIYEYFEGYTKEEIDAMLEKLTDNDHRLILLRFGEDLTKPFVPNMTQKERHAFYHRVQRMKQLLEHPELVRIIKMYPTDEVEDETLEPEKQYVKTLHRF